MTPDQLTIRQWAPLIGYPLVPATGEPAHGWRTAIARAIGVTVARVSEVSRGDAPLPRRWPSRMRAAGHEVADADPVSREPVYRVCAPYTRPSMGRPATGREAAYRVLAVDPMTTAELSRALRVDRREARRLVADLVERGLVENVTAAPPPIPLEDGDDGVTHR